MPSHFLILCYLNSNCALQCGEMFFLENVFIYFHVEFDIWQMWHFLNYFSFTRALLQRLLPLIIELLHFKHSFLVSFMYDLCKDRPISNISTSVAGSELLICSKCCMFSSSSFSITVLLFYLPGVSGSLIS